MQDASRAELLLELGILRVIRALRLLLGVQVVEVAEELVEAVRGRQELVPIAEMILAELSAHVAERFQDVGDRRILRLQPEVGARQADFGKPGANWRLTGDEGGATGGAALLSVPVGEVAPVPGDAVDVGRAVAHDAVVVHADVEPADVIAPDDQDVRLLLTGHDALLPRACECAGVEMDDSDQFEVLAMRFRHLGAKSAGTMSSLSNSRPTWGGPSRR